MPPLASFSDFAFLGLSPAELGIMIGMIALPVGLIMAVAGMYFRHQQQKLWHETARIALEKGQPVPPMPNDDDEKQHPRQDPGHDFRAGLILVATGAGLYFFLGRGIAAIVGFIGVALLIYAACVSLFRSKNPPQDPPSRS
jgi:hypothetical protein